MALNPYYDRVPGRHRHTPKQPVVTVRMYPELHSHLKQLAHEEQVSLNGLCLALLMKATEKYRK